MRIDEIRCNEKKMKKSYISRKKLSARKCVKNVGKDVKCLQIKKYYILGISVD